MSNNKLLLGYIGPKTKIIDNWSNNINYCAPELIAELNNPHPQINKKVDIFSFGCVIYEISELKSLFNQVNNIIENDLNFRLIENKPKLRDIFQR